MSWKTDPKTGLNTYSPDIEPYDYGVVPTINTSSAPTAATAVSAPTSYADIAGYGDSSVGFVPGTTPGVDDFWTMKGGGGLALGGIQTGIGLLGTLDAMKTAKLQRNLLGQQYDTNAEKMANWRSNTANVKSAFAAPGLAASGVPA